MARESKIKEINGNSWEVHPWPAIHGLKMQVKLAKTIGPALGAMSKADSVMDMEVSEVFTALAARLEIEESTQLIKDLIHGAFVNGRDLTQTAVFNDHFTANYGELYQGLAFIIQVNFGNFIELAGAIGSQKTGSKESLPAKTQQVTKRRGRPKKK